MLPARYDDDDDSCNIDVSRVNVQKQRIHIIQSFKIGASPADAICCHAQDIDENNNISIFYLTVHCIILFSYIMEVFKVKSTFLMYEILETKVSFRY